MELYSVSCNYYYYCYYNEHLWKIYVLGPVLRTLYIVIQLIPIAGSMGDVLHQIRGPQRRTRWGRCWTCSDSGTVGHPDEGLQKELIKSGVQRRNCGWRHKIEIVGTSLVAQWLGIRSSPGLGRSHRPRSN